VVVCGNKVDLFGKRVVLEENVKNAMADLKMKYFETSARTNEGINEVFDHIISQLMKNLSQLTDL